MTCRLETLEDWAAGLLEQFEPKSRSNIARSLGQALRRNQQQRIIAQQNPDGSKYAPRKQRNLRGKQGRVKRRLKMFQKMRTAGFLKVQVEGNAINVGFTGRVAPIARVHQYGLKERPEKCVADINYEKRELLGFTAADLGLFRDRLLNSFNSNRN